MITISILGSCVSRDIFSHLSQERYKVVNNIQRNPIETLNTEPLNIDDEIIKNFSIWNQRVLKMNFEKTVFKSLKEVRSDYIVIDLYDERYPIYELTNSMGKKTLVAKYINTETIIDKVVEKYGVTSKVILINNNLDQTLKESLDYYIENILNIYPIDRVVINEAYLLENYIDNLLHINNYPESANKYRILVNKKLNILYDYIENKMQGCHIIKMPTNTFGSENHIWGLNNVHPEPAFYSYALNCMDIITKNNFSFNLEGAYKEQCKNNLLKKKMIELINSKGLE